MGFTPLYFMPVRIHSCAASTPTLSCIVWEYGVHSFLLYACENTQLCSLYPYSGFTPPYSGFTPPYFMPVWITSCAASTPTLSCMIWNCTGFTPFYFMPVRISNGSHWPSALYVTIPVKVVLCTLCFVYSVRIDRVIPLSSTLHLQEFTVGSYCMLLPSIIRWKLMQLDINTYT